MTKQKGFGKFNRDGKRLLAEWITVPAQKQIDLEGIIKENE